MSIRSAIAIEWTRRGAQRDHRSLEQEVRQLRRQVDRLTLASLAMAEILRDQLGVSSELIEGKIQEIDLRDGKLDGEFHPPTRPCGDCGRFSSPKRATCLYCGAPLPKDHLLPG
jgi:hypothetical protein